MINDAEAIDNNLFADRFKIIEKYKGGMAEVLICQDIFNNRIVAAKTPYFAPELFSREARLWLGLGQHPNIVKAHLVHNIDNYPYLFMDFIGDPTGQPLNLRQALYKAPAREAFILDIGIAVISALKHAQAAFPGFVHRDIKPENIFIDDRANLYLSDFGIGHISMKSLEINQKYLKQNIVIGSTYYTKAGSFCGTIGYASPEQYFDSSSVTFKADIYSLGVIFYEALTGRIPYSPQMIDSAGFQILKIPPEKPHDLHGDFKLSIWNIILKMLNFNSDDRQESLEVIEYELKELRKKYCPLDNKFKYNKLKNTQLGKTTLFNRIYSLIELDDYQLATSNIISFRKRYPLSLNVTPITRKLFAKMPSKSNWAFLREMTISDLSNPVRLIFFIIFGTFLISPMYIAVSNSSVPLSKFYMGLGLLFILFIENYINSRTSISLDKITLLGIASGIIISLVLDLFNCQSLAGNFWNSIAGALLGLIIPLFFAWLYFYITKKDGIGGGTIKLLAMIGSWAGLIILPIILVATIVLISQAIFFLLIQRLPGELKWSKDTLIPRLHRRFKFAVPSSVSIFFATWINVSLPGLKDIFWA